MLKNMRNSLSLESFKLSPDHIHIHEIGREDNFVSIMRIDEEYSYYQLTNVASDVFLMIISSEGNGKKLEWVINKIVEKHGLENRDEIIESSLKLVEELVANGILILR
jgi:hypothetical protein